MRNRLLFVTTILGASALAGAAGASDAKIFPGSICQPVSGTTTYGIEGDIRNSSSATATVECPLVRDNTQSATPVINNANVWVTNPGPNTNSVSCSLYTEDNDSGSFFGQSVASTSISSTLQSLTFSSVNGDVGWAVHIRCTLPASLAPVGASRVKNIRWEEP